MTKESSIILQLPNPPSLNGLFAGQKRRVKSSEYSKRLLVVERIFKACETKYKIHGDEWLEIKLDYFFPLYTKAGKKKVKDLDNLFKALLDSLANNIEGFADHKIKIIIAEKHDSPEDVVNIEIKEII